MHRYYQARKKEIKNKKNNIALNLIKDFNNALLLLLHCKDDY